MKAKINDTISCTKFHRFVSLFVMLPWSDYCSKDLNLWHVIKFALEKLSINHVVVGHGAIYFVVFWYVDFMGSMSFAHSLFLSIEGKGAVHMVCRSWEWFAIKQRVGMTRFFDVMRVFIWESFVPRKTLSLKHWAYTQLFARGRTIYHCYLVVQEYIFKWLGLTMCSITLLYVAFSKSCKHQIFRHHALSELVKRVGTIEFRYLHDQGV